MLGFGVSEADLAAKIETVRELTSSHNAPKNLSLAEINSMGFLAVTFDSISRRFANGAISKSDRKLVFGELKEIEKQARKVMKR